MALPIYTLGRQEKVFVVPETTYGAAASAPASGHAVRFREFNVTQTEERVVRGDKKSTRSALETVVRRLSVSWSIKGYLLPSGAAGTAPDGWDDLFEYCLGTETINASTSCVYTLAKEFEKSLTLFRGFGSSLADAGPGEMVRGAVADQITFTLSGNDEAMVEISGFAADVLRAGRATIVTDSGTVVTPAAGEAHGYDAGTYVNIDTVTDQLISAVSTGSNTLTVPSHTAQIAGEFVVPSQCITAQSFVSTAVPVAGILGSLSLESASLDILAATVVVSNGAKPHNDQYGYNKAIGFHRENRKVTGSIQIRLDSSNFKTVAKTRRSTKVALSLVAGTTAGSIATFSLPNVIVDYSAIPSSAEGDTMVTLPFVAYATSSGEDEFTLTLT